MKRILFVCTGNTCRSPMAEYLWNQQAGKSLPLSIGESAGLTALEGMPISENARLALEEIGIDASAHSARRFSPALAAQADLIVAITPLHMEMILSICGKEVEKKLIVLGQGISDPYGYGLSTYEECRDEIQQQLPDVARNLLD